MAAARAAGPGVTGGVVGGLAGGAAVLVWGLLQKRRVCPGCGRPLPRVRRPGNARQAVWGGWTCDACGTECDRHGRPVAGAGPPGGGGPE